MHCFKNDALYRTRCDSLRILCCANVFFDREEEPILIIIG